MFWKENSLSFLLRFGCDELAASCKICWPCSLPCGTHKKEFFLPVHPRSVRKLPQELLFVSPNHAECRLL